jgi:hypothetical protein
MSFQIDQSPEKQTIFVSRLSTKAVGLPLTIIELQGVICKNPTHSNASCQ